VREVAVAVAGVHERLSRTGPVQEVHRGWLLLRWLLELVRVWLLLQWWAVGRRWRSVCVCERRWLWLLREMGVLLRRRLVRLRRKAVQLTL
jgi:hypothetical protein